MDADQKRLQSLSDDFQKLQTELQSNIDIRQRLESQQQESQSVQKEFAKLNDESNIYKLIGPVLLKQDRSEAVMSVNGRLDFIEKEISRIEGLIKSSQDTMEKKKTEIFQLQTTLQAQQEAPEPAS